MYSFTDFPHVEVFYKFGARDLGHLHTTLAPKIVFSYSKHITSDVGSSETSQGANIKFLEPGAY